MNRAFALPLLLLALCAQADRRVWLEEIDRTQMAVFGQAKPLEGHAVDGGLLAVGGKTYAHGLGVHAPNVLTVPLGGHALSFSAEVGLDDGVPRTSRAAVEFRVWVDGRLAASSGLLRKGKRRRSLVVDLAGARVVQLEVTDGGDPHVQDHADWADAFFLFKDGTGPVDPASLSPQLGILTPPAPAVPRINGPVRFGVRPGSPILYRVPVTGERPVAITVAGLPPGATFNPANASVNGVVRERGVYPLAITAANAKGTATRTVDLVVGDAFALTPPMGWNSWNAFTRAVTAEKVLAASEALLATGLADHGWNYVCVDDYWQNNPGEADDATLAGPVRAADGTILPNRRFPSMKALADAIHAKGLRAGLYSSPGPRTCGGCEGSWRHERQDARTYADWGFDFLKYDWCSYERVATGTGLHRARLPFLLMGRALREQPRDILFAICQYGRDNVSSWGSTVGGACWRTTADVFDTWGDVYDSLRHQGELWMWSAPGAFNDPDMLCVGKMKWNGYKGTRLSPNEQYTHMSLWCLAAAPLMIGCDLGRLDAFTLGLLTNDEVLAIDQDPLGKGAALLQEEGFAEVWGRPLADGSVALGLLNANLLEREIAFDLAGVGLDGTWHVRDVWRQRDEADACGVYRANVYGHATHLVRLSPAADGRVRAGCADIREASALLKLENRRDRKAKE